MRAAIRTALLGALPLLGACGAAVTSSGTGSVVLTDAGLDDIAAFEVDVTGIVFRKAGGSSVAALPRTTRIDFAQFESLSQLVARTSLEAGLYTGLTLTLDFANAVVYLKDKTAPATLLDGSDNPLTGTLSIPIDFATADRPNVAALRNHTFVLDLDLAQAISTDLPGNSVRFVPAIGIEVDPTNPKPIASTGEIVSIDAQAGQITAERRNLAGDSLGQFVIQVLPTTVCQVDGVVHLGAAGLTALQALPAASRLWVQGILSNASSILFAGAIEAGAGTFGNGQDWVLGFVTARTGGSTASPTLTVRGQSRVAANGGRRFNTDHTVTGAFGTTKVLRRGAANSMTTDNLQVGQLVLAFGTLSGTSLDAGSATGVVRMLPTSVFGIAAGAPVSNRLTLNVARIGWRSIGDFDFDVSGNTQSDPAAYTIDVAAIDTTGITAGSKIRAIGWTNPVDVGADSDFTPTTVVNRSTEAMLLFSGWTPRDASSVLTIASALSFDPTNAASSFVYDGFSQTDLSTSPLPQIRPRFALGIYRIVESGGVELHFGFPAFLSALTTRMADSPSILRLGALGTFDGPTQVFSASVVTVVLQ